MMGQSGGHGHRARDGSLKESAIRLGAKEKVGGDRGDGGDRARS